MPRYKARVVTTIDGEYQPQIALDDSEYADYGTPWGLEENAINAAKDWLNEKTFAGKVVWEGEV